MFSVNHKRILTSLFILLFISCIINAQEKNVRKKLLIGGDSNYPPYEYIDKEGNPAGFCVDVVKAVCNELKIKPEFHLMEWRSVRTQFDENKLDMLEGMASSEERLKHYVFADPIISLEFTYFLRKGEQTIASFESLRGKEILVENRDVIHDKLIKEGFLRECIPVSGPEEIIKRLSSGEATCGITPRLIGSYILRTHNIENIFSQDTTILRYGYGFALSKKDTALRDELNTALREIKQKGIYDKIYDKWFGILKPEGITVKEVMSLAFWILIPITLVLVIFYLWSVTLKKQVKQKTVELKSELEEKKIIEKILEKEKELLTITLKSIGEGVVCTDANGNITLINHAAQRLLFTDKNPVGMLFDDAFRLRIKSQKKDFIREIVTEAKILNLNKDVELLALDDSKKNISLTGSPVVTLDGDILGTVLILIDLTEKLQLEKELNKAQNLEMVGVLAGGIAHDFNNLLTAILGNLSLAKMFVDKDNKVYERIIKSESAALRAKDLTHQLLSFSKGGSPVKKISNIANVVKDTVDFVLSGSSVKSIINIEENIWNIEFDEGQISQVMSNLVINAIQAMGEKATITINVKNYKKILDKETGHQKFVLIEITDTGKGMEQSVIDKIFQPYYTTKKTGHGLGLAMVYSIIKNHDGYIEVNSMVGKGTTFQIFIPV